MKLIDPPQKLTLQFLKFISINIARNKSITKRELFEHFEKTEWYMDNALYFLNEHNIINVEDGIITISKEKAHILEKSESERLKVFLGAIASTKPFIEFYKFIQTGHSDDEAVKLVVHLYDLENSVSSVKSIFKKWIKLLDVEVKKVSVEEASISSIINASQNRLLASTFIKEELGDYFKIIPQSIQDDLSESIQQIQDDTQEAINSCGRALEDFLRLVVGEDENLTKCNGIGQIASILNQNKSKYPSKLNNIATSIGGIRAMGTAHGVDKQFNKEWNVSTSSSYSMILLTLCLIKSYLIFGDTGELVF